MITKVNKLIIEQLETSEIARNNHKQGYIEYVKKHHCRNSLESSIIELVLTRAITQASYQREIAHIQNNLGLYKPNPKEIKRRTKQETKIRQELSKNNLWDSFYRFFKQK